jgi:hypothetical protein
MSKTLFYIFIAAILVLGAERFGLFATAPCTEPIEYSLGTFDKRFGLTQNQFLSALAQAEAVWETPSSKNLFAYVPEEGELSVNLIYDYRQEATEVLNELENDVKSEDARYKALQADYLRLKSEHARVRGEYERALSLFETHNLAYEASIMRWNSGPRTSKQEFEALESERRALEIEIASLRAIESRLNSLVKEVNVSVGKLNTLARELNLNVEEYNEIGASRGETFTGGLYTSDRNGERIDVFEFENQAKLVRVLAHELGHALGLEHLPTRGAIMYELNQGEAAKATAADIEALEALCKS